MSRVVLCNCPVGFAADPARHAPDCPGRSGAGKPSLAPAGNPGVLIAVRRPPRAGLEFWDKICALKHYGFLLAPEGNRVVKAEGIGNWIDMHEAQQVVDAAQSEINDLRADRDQGLAREAVLTARLEQKITEIIDEATKAIDSYRKEGALQERLNIADQRVDDLEAENEALRKDAGRHRMSQSRKASAAETLVGVLVGLAVSMVANAIVFPLYDFHPSLLDNAAITLVYTGISLVRGYCLRRAFNRLASNR